MSCPLQRKRVDCAQLQVQPSLDRSRSWCHARTRGDMGHDQPHGVHIYRGLASRALQSHADDDVEREPHEPHHHPNVGGSDRSIQDRSESVRGTCDDGHSTIHGRAPEFPLAA